MILLNLCMSVSLREVMYVDGLSWVPLKCPQSPASWVPFEFTLKILPEYSQQNTLLLKSSPLHVDWKYSAVSMAQQVKLKSQMMALAAHCYLRFLVSLLPPNLLFCPSQLGLHRGPQERPASFTAGPWSTGSPLSSYWSPSPPHLMAQHVTASFLKLPWGSPAWCCFFLL